MRGTSSVEAEIFDSTARLPPQALALLDASAGLFTNQSWWDVVLSHAMPDGAAACFVVIRGAGQVVAVVPMVRTRHPRAARHGSSPLDISRGGKGSLDALTTPYTCEYTPLFAPGLDPAARVGAMAAFGGFCRRFGVVRIDALPADWDGLADLQAGCRRSGLHVARFDHFGNWFEDVDGLDWPAYLLRRSGAPRETIRRRLRRAEKLPDARFDLLTAPEQMDQAATAFDSVYRRSWKQPEPFPTFNAALMRAMAADGLLRFGVWSIGDEPVAVQFWVVRNGHATVLKLAHDEAYKAHSPGTVLTALMLRHLLDREHVARIDFGRGDDAYKKGWANQRRQMVGVLLVNPWCVPGAVALSRHAAGRLFTLFRRHVPSGAQSVAKAENKAADHSVLAKS